MGATTFFTASLSPEVYGKQYLYHIIRTEPLKAFSLGLYPGRLLNVLQSCGTYKTHLP